MPFDRPQMTELRTCRSTFRVLCDLRSWPWCSCGSGPRRRRSDRPTPGPACPRKAPERSPSIATRMLSARTRRFANLSPGVAEVHASLGFSLLPARQVRAGRPCAAAGDQAEAVAAERGRPARHVAVRAGAIRGSVARPGKRRSSSRPTPRFDARPASSFSAPTPGSSAMRTPSTSRSADAPLSRRPGGPLPRQPAVRELRVRHAAASRGGRAGLAVGAPGRRRSEREPGPGRGGAEGISGGRSPSTRSGPGSTSGLGRVLLARAEQATPDADAERPRR